MSSLCLRYLRSRTSTSCMYSQCLSGASPQSEKLYFGRSLQAMAMVVLMVMVMVVVTPS